MGLDIAVVIRCSVGIAERQEVSATVRGGDLRWLQAGIERHGFHDTARAAVGQLLDCPVRGVAEG